MLVTICTHPIQYHAPVFRHLQEVLGIPVTAIYGSDFSVAGYRDKEFGAEFAWDADLLSGYSPHFLARVGQGGASEPELVSSAGMDAALARLRPSAVLSMGYRPQYHVDGFRIARRMGLPILFRAETTDHASSRGWFKNFARDLVLRRHYHRCAAALYIGQHSRAHFQRLGVPPARLFFAPYCVDTSSFQVDEAARRTLRELARQELGAPDETLVLGFFGKLSERKAPGLIIEAIRLLPAEVQRRCLVLLVGDGEQRDRLRVEATRAPAVELRHVGFQNQRALSRWYHACDVAILPSVRGETWGLVTNEALHHGVPVIVSEAVGCAPDLVESGLTGEIVATGSAEALAHGLTRLLPLVGNAAVRAQCRSRVAEYSVARAAEGIATAYRDVLARGSGPVGNRESV